MARHIVLTSPLDPIAIATKLKAMLGDGNTAPVKGVTGSGSEQSMALLYFRPNIQNSFQAALTAMIEPEGSGARIEGMIGTPRSLVVFMWCWFGGLTAMLVTVGSGMIASRAAFGDKLFLVAVPVGLMAVGALLLSVGNRVAKTDEAAILAFLETAIAARVPMGER
ncbi:MAG: hypothetical protein ABI810_07445 [Sphingomonas bacterium]